MIKYETREKRKCIRERKVENQEFYKLKYLFMSFDKIDFVSSWSKVQNRKKSELIAKIKNEFLFVSNEPRKDLLNNATDQKRV